MDTYTALLNRRTIHEYRDEPISEEAVQRALQAALRAPNHKLTNPWRFTRVGPRGRAELVRLGVELKAAKKGSLTDEQRDYYRQKFANPAELVVVSQVLDADPFRRREDYAAIACAVQNFLLSLWAEGIGSKWSTGGITTDERTYELLQIDADTEEIVGFLWAGVPAETPNPPRRPLEAVLRTTE